MLQVCTRVAHVLWVALLLLVLGALLLRDVCGPWSDHQVQLGLRLGLGAEIKGAVG